MSGGNSQIQCNKDKVRFADIAGNEEVVKALAGMVDSGKIPHAIMLHEDDGGGAFSIVQAFLQYLYCRNRSEGDSCGECPGCNKIGKLIHPDVHYIYPVNTGSSTDFVAQWRELVQSNPSFTENELSDALGIEGKTAMIKVEEAKKVLDVLSLYALERGYRALVIYLPEKMNREAANRLLKAVEEPPEKTLFLMVTHSPDSVLPTISSRCLRLRVMPRKGTFRSVGQAEDPELLRRLVQAALARDLGAALEAADTAAALPSRERAKGFCRYAAERLRFVFLLQQDLDSMVELPEGELAELRDWAARSPKTFPRKAADALSRAQGLIERNVNLKILFTDLVDRIYTAI